MQPDPREQRRRFEAFDPSSVNPLDYFGWDEYGDFAPAPTHERMVADLVRMYGLHRMREERGKTLKVLRALLSSLVADGPKEDTMGAIRAVLTATSACLGPVREYLLRPPSEDDAWLVRGALHVAPEIRTLVDPWLRPPAWAPAWWR